MCMVNLLVIPQKIVVVFYYMIDLLRLFQTRSFVLSSEHENQNIATLGTLLDQLMLSCKYKNVLLAFLSVCHILDRDKTTSLGNKMLLKALTRHKLRNDHKLAVH